MSSVSSAMSQISVLNAQDQKHLFSFLEELLVLG